MSNTPMLRFDRARSPGELPPPDVCAYCSRTLSQGYYRVAGHLACQACAAHAETLLPPDSHRAYTRALLAGSLAALAGCLGYALFEIVTGILLGYIAIGVGLLVGWAMKKGSGGLGGRRYQITAALLTYAAVAVAFVPVALHELGSRGHGQTATQRADANDAQVAQSDAAHATGSTPDSSSKHGLGSSLLACLMLLGLGLVSPFLQFSASVANGLLNLLIIGIGVRFAWRYTAGAPALVEGPFSTAGASAEAEPRG